MVGHVCELLPIGRKLGAGALIGVAGGRDDQIRPFVGGIGKIQLPDAEAAHDVFVSEAISAARNSGIPSGGAGLVYLRGPGAEQCPGEAAIRGAVSSRLGYDPFFAWARDTLFTEIDRSGDAFRAVVKLVDANNLQRGAR